MLINQASKILNELWINSTRVEGKEKIKESLPMSKGHTEKDEEEKDVGRSKTEQQETGWCCYWLIDKEILHTKKEHLTGK